MGWVERHKACENYYILCRFVAAIFESICSPTLSQKFYVKLEEKYKEKWSEDKQTVSKSQGLYCTC